MSNDDQIEYWNGPAGQRWASFADALDGMLAPFVPAILSAAALKPGDRVLDVGCGGGALALAAAQAVGATGAVQGVDVSKPLIDLAVRRAETAGAAARFTVADASTWTSETHFDVLMSRFGVMFFDDPEAAFQNLRAAMAPGGRLAFACWRPMAENEWVAAPLRAVLPLLSAPPTPPPPGAPGPFAFGDRARIEDLLKAAGWTEAAVAPWDGDIVLPGDTAEDASRFALEIGPISRLLQEEDIPTEAALERLAPLFSERRSPEGRTALSGAAWIVRARAA